METSVPALLAKKRDGEELSDADIKTFVAKVVNKEIDESQIGAMLMAMYIRDLSRRETVVLTQEMTATGSTLSWPREWEGQMVDKHSTGGVGDKVSLVLAPALAATGLKVPMVSGRGLAHTGGTLDKLEACEGYNVLLSPEDMRRILDSVGCFIAGQTENVCPADKRLYAIRDVTATVPHIGLITASIVSKKAAEGLNTLVLDVKTGKGAFMAKRDDAVKLAESMVQCSQDVGIKTVALITEMSTPLGNAVGNALEVMESICCLQNQGPKDLLDLVVAIGGHVLATNNTAPSPEDGSAKIRDVIANGQALAKFCAMLKAQGVAAQLADDLCDPDKDPRSSLPRAAHQQQIKCTNSGNVQAIDAMAVARACHQLGGGRNVPGEAINLAVGVELLVDLGDQVDEGQPWVTVHYDDHCAFDNVRHLLDSAIDIGPASVLPRSRVLQVVS